VSFWGTPKVVPAGSKMKGSCRFGAPAAMIRHLVVEKISLTPDFSTITYLIYEIEALVLPLQMICFFEIASIIVKETLTDGVDLSRGCISVKVP
jgi:hypothetical protein